MRMSLTKEQREIRKQYKTESDLVESLDVNFEILKQKSEELLKGDTRYNVPKQEPTVPEEVITHTIETNDIYSKAKEIILNAQRRQVAYGIQKYPEPLNANSWSAVEAIDHILEESIDQIHYLVMLREKILNEPQTPYLDMRKMMEKARNRKG